MPPQPDPFADTFMAMAGARAVIAATRLGLLDSLAAEPATPSELAARLALEPAGVEALTTALVAMGYLETDSAGRQRPREEVARLLTTGAPESIAAFVGDYNAHAWTMLGRLEDVARGEAEPPQHAPPPGDPFWEPYIRGLFQLSRAEHEDNVAAVGAEDPRRLLDVAGGHGGFAMAMCRRHPRLSATVLDLPASAAVGRRIVAEQGLSDRIAFREGDALDGDLGGGWDVCSAFNLLHHLAPEAIVALLRRLREALAPGGRLVIGETERAAAGETVEPAGALSAVVYFASSGTRNYTVDEVRAWLSQAGFPAVDVRRNRRSPWRVLYVARS